MAKLKYPRRVGRPRKWDKVETLQKQIDKYFDDCDNHKVEVVEHTPKGEKRYWVSQPKPYTVAGLCRALGTNRTTLLNYRENYEPAFFDALKNAQLRIEEQLEEKLNNGNNKPVGIIFNLKNNYGWKDEKTNNLRGNIEVTPKTIDTKKLSDKELKELRNLLDKILAK